MTDCIAYGYVTEEGDIVSATVGPNEIAVMANAILLGSNGGTVPQGNWTENMVRGAYGAIMQGRGRIVRVKITTLDN